jgi:hypothetical protein
LIKEDCDMKMLGAVLALSVLGITGASAQGAISGPYQCIQNCKGPGLARITQAEQSYDLNLVNEVGEPSRGWIDRPSHIWADDWHEGAIVSPDGMTVQFDNGSVWQRFVALPPLPPAPPPPPRVRHRIHHVINGS